jgi:hypothetical protein
MSRDGLVANVIQTPTDKLRHKNDMDFEDSVTTKDEQEFEVTIYEPITPELSSDLFETGSLEGRNVNNYSFYRGRATNDRHAFLPFPENATTQEEYEKFRNLHFQCVLKKDSPADQKPKTGDIWSCTMIGPNMVRLEKRVDSTGVNLEMIKTTTAEVSGSSGAAAAYRNPYNTVRTNGSFPQSGYKPPRKIFYKGPMTTTAEYDGTPYKNTYFTNGSVPRELMRVSTEGYRKPNLYYEASYAYDKLAKAFRQHFSEQGYVLKGSGDRTYETQIKIYEDPKKQKMVKGKLQHLGAYPGTSLHGYGIAVDIAM